MVCKKKDDSKEQDLAFIELDSCTLKVGHFLGWGLV